MSLVWILSLFITPQQILASDKSLIRTMSTLDKYSPNWKWLSTDLQNLLENYPTIHRREVSKGLLHGKFIHARARFHGIGNRVNCLIGAFVIALLTNRALIIHWDSNSDCPQSLKVGDVDQRGKNFTRVSNGIADMVCDPVSVDDLFELPYGLDWRGRTLPHSAKACPTRGPISNALWVMKGNDDLANFYTLFQTDFAKFHQKYASLCTETDRPYFWAATCNMNTRAIFPDPWIAFGALQDYLLPPSRAVRERVYDQFHNQVCLAGVHLRKEQVYNLDNILENLIGILNSTAPDTNNGVFIASDPFSLPAKQVLEETVKKFGHRILEATPLSAQPTRATKEGLIDAAVENTILAFCKYVLPFVTGKSTYHDIALARSVWRLHPKPDELQIMLGDREDSHHMSVPKEKCVDPHVVSNPKIGKSAS